MSMDLKIILERCVDGGYTVYIPAFPGCVSEGDTEEEAMSNLSEAFALWLETKESMAIEHCTENASVRHVSLAFS